MTDVEKKFKSTSFGDVAYLEVGPADRPPVLFIHGIPTSSYLWRQVLRLLQNDFRCVAPDLMGLGDTDVDPATTPLHMEAQAEMLEELMGALGHQSFSVVCHDQGGAAAQLLAAFRPQLIRCLVLTDCVCYDNWPVPLVAALQGFFRLPLLPEAAIAAGVFTARRAAGPLFRTGVYNKKAFTDEAIDEYLRPLHESARGRERVKRFFLAGSPAFTRRALPGLRRFERPTLILWAADDRHISPSWGRKLAEEIPGARGFELVPFCGHFWQEERPGEFVSHIGPFLAEHAREEAPSTQEVRRA